MIAPLPQDFPNSTANVPAPLDSLQLQVRNGLPKTWWKLMRCRLHRKLVRSRIMLPLVLFATLLAPAATQAWTYKVLYHFCSQRSCLDGAYPEAPLLLDSAGNIYGTTTQGGKYGLGLANTGTAFELLPNADRTKWKRKTLYSFCQIPPNCTDGALPKGALFFDASNNLYGAQSSGGGAGRGTIFELLPNGDKQKRSLKTLHAFNSDAEGIGPLGVTYQGAATGAPYDGVSPLFGVTAGGGQGTGCGFTSCGIAFTLILNGGVWTETAIYDFCSQSNCADGGHPVGPMIVDQAGNLYGTTANGGPSGGGGAVFRLVNGGGSWTQTVLYGFCALRNCKDGANPQSAVTMDASGALFGTASQGGRQKGCFFYGCGVTFRLTPDGGQFDYSAVYEFCERHGCKDGATPSGTLVADSAGNLYGTTETGGGNNIDEGNLGGGTVFKLSGSSLETLHAFCAEHHCSDGEYPYAGIVMDPAGNLYGTAEFGGKYGGGVVFELSP